jgi:hypothetical protein
MKKISKNIWLRETGAYLCNPKLKRARAEKEQGGGISRKARAKIPAPSSIKGRQARQRTVDEVLKNRQEKIW